MAEDGTLKIPRDSDRGPTTQEQVRQLVQRVKDLTELMHTQRELLRQRGMSLPTGSLDNLRTLKARIDGLSKQLGNSLVELQSLRALADNAALINSSLDLDTVLSTAMDTVINITGAERGYIVLRNPQTGALDQFRVARGLNRTHLTDDSEATGSKKNELIISKSIVNKVAESGEPELTDNASEDPNWQAQQSIANYSLRSILAVPLKVRDEVIGVVYCDNSIVSGLFQASDRDLLAAFANQAGVAIENARLFEAARAQLQQLTEMRDLMMNIFDSVISAILTVDADGVVSLCNAAASGILGVDDVVGRPIEEALPPLDDDFYAALRLVLDEGMQQMLEVETTINGGSRRFWNVIVSPLRDADGNVGQGLAMVLDDITDQKLHEAQMKAIGAYLPPALMKSLRSVDVTGQEREITVISTDVRGFTSFSEHLQPEEVMEIINKYLSLASDAINLYEGIVDKYMGDAVTGLFNTQLNEQEDHAVRAVRAAINIIYDLYALHEVLPEEQRLFYGIGIHTGSAYLGNVGGADRKEFSALGDAATVAKILEGNAGPGEIIISEATYQLVQDVFECEERVPEKTKGRTDLERVYHVMKRKKGVSTGSLFLDPELAELLKDIGSDNA